MRMPESPLQCRPPFDDLLVQITDYVAGARIEGHEAHQTARYCLMDTLGCALLALRDPACTKLLGPVVPGTIVPQGSRVPGTKLELDPVMAAFNIGALIRWLDFNDTWPIGSCSARSCQARSCPKAAACQEPSWNWIRSWPLSTSARSSVGSISMTPGWLRNGGTPPTTWVLFSRRQIMSAAKKWLKDSGLTSCTRCCSS